MNFQSAKISVGFLLVFTYMAQFFFYDHHFLVFVFVRAQMEKQILWAGFLLPWQIY